MSDDTAVDEQDTLVAMFSSDDHPVLGAGGSYTWDQAVTLPSATVGDRYLLFVADADGQHPEPNENNNLQYSAIQLVGADLVLTDVTAPNEATIEETVTVTWSVANQGNSVAEADWTNPALRR